VFITNGVNVFQGAKIGITHQIKLDYDLHMQGIHYMAHQANLATKALSKFNVVYRLENLFQTLYAYFNENPNRHLKFNKLVKIMEIQGNKLINNVKTRWISILEPTKRVMINHILVVKMTFDAKMNFKLLCDVDVLYGLVVLLPLVEEMNNPIKLALAQDVFLVDYGNNQALNVRQIHFVNLYTIFKFDVFDSLKSLVGPSHDPCGGS